MQGILDEDVLFLESQQRNLILHLVSHVDVKSLKSWDLICAAFEGLSSTGSEIANPAHYLYSSSPFKLETICFREMGETERGETVLSLL